MRTAKIERNTNETKISVELNLDKYFSEIDTKIGFFDHMLDQIARHANIGLKIKCDGDINVDSHHTIEDVGLCIGLALKECLGDFTNIKRYGKSIIPMDEALVLSAIDLCNRPYAVIDNCFTADMIGEYQTEMTPHFFKSLADNARINIHIMVLRGENNHHIVEGMFKAFAHALKEACEVTNKTISTKGVL